MVEKLVSQERRQVLAAATFQYASSLQTLRENALDQLFLKLLFTLDGQEYAALDQIRLEYENATHGGHIPKNSAVQVLDRLRQADQVESPETHLESYRLTERTKKSLEVAEDRADSQITELICRLFNCTSGAAKNYEQPFMAVITGVAATLGEESASLLVNREHHLIAESDFLSMTIDDVISQNCAIGKQQFRIGVLDFFRSADPDCHGLLWQLTESYFVMRLLGMDPSGRALSKELFQRTEFILDTNTILAALVESDDNHELVNAVLNAIQQINIPMIVADITLDELNSVLDRHFSDLSKIVDRGESKWLPRLDSAILREYEESTYSTPAEFFERFNNVEEILSRRWKAKVVYVDPSRSSAEVNAFAQKLQSRYRRGGAFDRNKSQNVALHDAKILTYVLERKEGMASNLWLLTLDSSLPGIVPNESDWPSLALTPRNVFQWLAPVVVEASTSNEFSRVFSEMVQSRFLPRRPFLSTSDFSALLDVQDNVDQIPDEDIESILGNLRAKAPSLDTSKPADREKLTGIISSSLSDKNSRIQKRYRELEIERDSQILELRAEKEAESGEWQRRLAESEIKKAEEIEAERNTRTEADAKRDASEGVFRFWVAVGGLSVVGLFLGWQIGNIWLESATAMSDVMKLLAVTLVSPVSLIILAKQLFLRRVVGEQRISAMPQPYRNVLGG